MVADCSYPSLADLPGTKVDQYGNLRLIKTDDLRKQFEYLMSCPQEYLAGRNLAELLEWWRWGSSSGVMWEATVVEIIQLIERWELANPNAEASLYVQGRHDNLSWEEVWSRAYKTDISEGRKCECGRLLTGSFWCKDCVCGNSWWAGEIIVVGRRGPYTYNTYLHGASGDAVAMAAFNSRNWIRLTPDPITDPIGSW